MKMKKLGLLLMLLCASFAMHAQELKKGDKLPDFQLKSSVYGDVSSADLKGKVVLVSLFAYDDFYFVCQDNDGSF